MVEVVGQTVDADGCFCGGGRGRVEQRRGGCADADEDGVWGGQRRQGLELMEKLGGSPYLLPPHTARTTGVRRPRRPALAGRRSCRLPHTGDPSVVRQGEDLRVASNGEVLEFEGRGRGGVLDDRGEDRPPCARAAPLNLDWIEFLGSGSLTESFVASCSWGSWGGGRVRVSGGMRGRNQRTLALYIYFNLLGPHVNDINMSVTCDLNHRFGTDGWIKLGWNGPSHFFTV
jgi:hypothetical protein